MDRGSALLAAVFFFFFSLFAAASCAPAALSLDPCAVARSSSLELNQIAKRVSQEARNGSNSVLESNTLVAWMEPKDMCDPGSLKHKPGLCTWKMLDVLKCYKSALNTVAGLQSCSKFVEMVKSSVEKLHKDMSRCVPMTGGTHPQQETPACDDTHPAPQPWEEELLCYYTMDRLFSFSILAARVFAVGDPTGHTEGPVLKCM